MGFFHDVLVLVQCLLLCRPDTGAKERRLIRLEHYLIQRACR